MPRRRAPQIPQRLRVLLSCEGQSERAYGIWLYKRAQEIGLHVHIDAKICRPPGGGDLLGLVEDTEVEILRANKRGVPYAIKGIMLDTDMRGRNTARDREAFDIANKYGLQIIWQEHDHEAFLLRHLVACQMHRPPPGQGGTALLRQLPNYRKPWDADMLERVIDAESLRRALAVEQQLRGFLMALSWPL